ncbi:testin [Plutella xylostella]|uniref:testin n=1 Tax=Plutella xylostella TaxID=51655 RepID=UPI0020323116|nr:testin [Plutella xylostella]
MSESCVETPEAPAWLSKLESQREKLSKARLGHDSGAGAPCNSCGSGCPGLDLHFWRKVCRACHCSKDVHDVQDDDLSGWAQFELLGTAKPKKSILPLIKIRGVADNPVKLDWAPPNASTELVSEYMSCLGALAPVAGSAGARRRRAQLRTQLPPHDVAPEVRAHATDQEKSEHTEYISRIKDHVVGVGSVVRVAPLQTGDVCLVETARSHAPRSYALPLKISNLCRGVKYNIVPKNASDKKLVLDSQGNVVSSAANLPDYKTSSVLSRGVVDKLVNMKIESDRIKSAVEHGPVYDKLFKNLADLNIPVHSDVYLQPIKLFRDEYNKNAQFQEETNEFASQALSAQAMPDLWSSANNNIMGAAKFLDSRIQKGTIFAPNGEIWSWKHEVTTPETSGTICSTKISPQYSTSTSTTNQQEPQKTAPLRDYLRSHSGEDAPPPNYHTYPGALPPPPDYAASYDDSIDPLIDQLTSMDLSPEEVEFNRKLYNEGVPCQRCRQPMFAGSVAVKAERAGGSAVWHPQCFTCVGCGELLADLVYFFHRGEIYCARDLAAALDVPRCAGCDELVFTRPYTAAEGRAFHVQHFCCYHCDAPLGGQKYVPDDRTGLPVCLTCYDQFYAERCRACSGVIGPEQQGVSWGAAHWHAACFVCSGRACGKSLLSGRFVVKQDMPFCSVPCVQSKIKS